MTSPRGLDVLVSKGEMLSTWSCDNDSPELEIETDTQQPLWAPHASESTGKEENLSAGWVIGPDSQGAIGLPLHNGAKGRIP